MFYLLENNRIVDSEELSNSGIHINIKENVMYLDSWLGTRFYGTIKKQSENVFELIEKEDLIKIKMCDTFSILEVKNINGGVSGMRHIVAIYKQDEKGNYIKVWEVKKNGRNN